MPSFDHDADLTQALDFRLLANTAVTMFWRRAILNETCDWLRAHGYQITALNAAEWSSEADLHTALAAAFDFPDYYGRNLDALNDCMRDVVAREYGWDPNALGLAIVFDHYDAFAAKHPRSAQIVLNIMAAGSRSAALFGERLMCLIQTNDAQINFSPVGATPVMWSDAEWLDSLRREQ